MDRDLLLCQPDLPHRGRLLRPLQVSDDTAFTQFLCECHLSLYGRQACCRYLGVSRTALEHGSAFLCRCSCSIMYHIALHANKVTAVLHAISSARAAPTNQNPMQCTLQDGLVSFWLLVPRHTPDHISYPVT